MTEAKGRKTLSLVAACAGLVIGLLLAEAALRVAGVSYPPFLMYDPDRMVRHRAGVAGWQSEEGKAYVRINSQGLRDREHALAKPPDTIRIAVLGDSFAEAGQVDASKAFWAVMERELSRCSSLGNRSIELINFGVGGYGTSSEWIALQKDVWRYSPDIVLLAFFTGNDVRNNSYALERNQFMPYFVLQDGKLVRVLPAGEGAASRRGAILSIWQAIQQHSRFSQLIEHVRTRYSITLPKHVFLPDKKASDVAQEWPKASGEPWGAETGLDSAVYSAPADQAWKAAWEVTEALIAEMNREIVSKGKKMFLATLSNPIQVVPETETRAAFVNRFGLVDLYYPDRRIMDVARRENINSVMLAPMLLEWAVANRTCVHGFDNTTKCGGHWNEHGHRVAGDILSREICSQMLNGEITGTPALRDVGSS